MRILVCTQEEPFYLPRFFEGLLRGLGEHVVAGVNILPPFNAQASWRQVAGDYWGLFGAREFLAQGLRFAAHKAADRLCLPGGPHSVRRVFARAGVPIHRIRAQHGEEFRRLAAVDVLVSVANPIILRRPVLEAPRLGAINFHSGYLPRYRGINPCFWTLLHREKETALTVHRMDEKPDNGPILGQLVVPIDATETLHSLFGKVVALGPGLLLRVLDQLARGVAVESPNDASRATYFGFPSPEDGRRFRALGLRFR